jgi:hypothetical protein
MAVVALVVVAVLAFAIAAVVVGREAQRLGSQRLQPVYRLPEAVGSVADALDADAASLLTEHEVSEVVRMHLNLLQFETRDNGQAGSDDDEAVELDGESVVDERDASQTVYRNVRRSGLDISRPHVELIMDLHIDYLRAIGAVGEVDGEKSV